MGSVVERRSVDAGTIMGESSEEAGGRPEAILKLRDCNRQRGNGMDGIDEGE